MNLHTLDDNGRHLVEENMPLVPFTISKYFHSCPEEWDELMSIGNLALCMAAANYKPEMGFQFSTYAVQAIKTHIWRAIDRHNAFMVKGGKCVVSLNEPAYDDEEREEELFDTIWDPSQETDNQAIEKIAYDKISDLVPTFKQVRLDGYTIREIAKDAHKSVSAIRERIAREKRRAKHTLIDTGWADSFAR